MKGNWEGNCKEGKCIKVVLSFERENEEYILMVVRNVKKKNGEKKKLMC